MKARILSVLFLLTLASQTTTRAGVLPPDAVVADRTIAEWSVEWWKWIFSIPVGQHPIFDTNGSRAQVGQPGGAVFFLAGLISPESGLATRRFEVPEDKYLFFPMLNSWVDNVFVIPPLTVEQMREQNAAFIALISELHVRIDGVAVTNLFAHRAVAPVFSFEYTFPDSLESYLAGTPILGLVDPIVSDGYWLMVEPLPPGEHVINFGGTFGPPVNFTLDITDHITVVAVPLTQRMDELMAKVAAANLAPNRVQPLRASLEAARASFDRDNLQASVNQLRAFQHKVRAQVEGSDPALARELIQSAERIIERATRQRQ